LAIIHKIVGPPRESAVEEAVRILGRAESEGVVLRLLGGVAIYLRCPSARGGGVGEGDDGEDNSRSKLARIYRDIDFIGHARQSREIRKVFGELGYLPEERFNAIHGSRRLVFTNPEQQRRIDVFLDVFEMCHKFDLSTRMEIDNQTIPLADLLATKLQIIQTNEKDVGDMICLLLDHEIGNMDSQDTINGEYLAKLCSEDWGIYKTFTMKLKMLTQVIGKWDLKESQKALVGERIERLRKAIEGTPKSMSWKMRATIGEKVRWYNVPEEQEDIGLAQVPAEER
jgi:hypothetical protein